MDVPEVFEARLNRYRSVKASTKKRRQQAVSRRDARVVAKEAVVDLVSYRSEMGENDRACSSATGIGRIEESKHQRRGGRCDGAASKSRGKEGRVEAVETVSDAKEELAVGLDYEVNEARASDYTVDSPRTKALQLEEILVGQRDNLSEGINRLRWLIDFGYNSSMVSNGCREKPRSKRKLFTGSVGIFVAYGFFWCLIVDVG